MLKPIGASAEVPADIVSLLLGSGERVSRMWYGTVSLMVDLVRSAMAHMDDLTTYHMTYLWALLILFSALAAFFRINDFLISIHKIKSLSEKHDMLCIDTDPARRNIYAQATREPTPMGRLFVVTENIGITNVVIYMGIALLLIVSYLVYLLGVDDSAFVKHLSSGKKDLSFGDASPQSL